MLKNIYLKILILVMGLAGVDLPVKAEVLTVAHSNFSTFYKISTMKINKEVWRSIPGYEDLYNECTESMPVCQFTKDMIFVKEFHSTMDVQRQLGIDNSSISKVARGKRKTSHGFIWKYKKDLIYE